MKKINDSTFLLTESKEDPSKNLYLFIESGSVTLPKVIKKAILTESGGSYIEEMEFCCPCLPTDIETGNGRTYPGRTVDRSLLEAAPKFLDKSLVCSANDHPEEVTPVPTSISHHVTNAFRENGHLHIQAQIAPTHHGTSLMGLINKDYPLGISVRGTGNLDPSGRIVENYTFLGADFVASPSTGLHVFPEWQNNIQVQESQIIQPEVINKEVILEQKQPTKKEKRVSNLTIEALKSVLEESGRKIKSAKSKSDKQTIITVTESKLATFDQLITEGTMGLQEMISIIKEWLELKEENLYSDEDGQSGLDTDMSDNKRYQDQNAGVSAACKTEQLEKDKQIKETLNRASDVVSTLKTENSGLKKQLEESKVNYKKIVDKANAKLKEQKEKHLQESQNSSKNKSTVLKALIESRTRVQEEKIQKLNNANTQSNKKNKVLESKLIKALNEKKALTESSAAALWSLETLATLYSEAE